MWWMSEYERVLVMFMLEISTLDSAKQSSALLHTRSQTHKHNTAVQHQPKIWVLLTCGPFSIIIIITFKNQVLVLQVEPFSVACPPQSGRGWVVAAAAAWFHDGLRVRGFPQRTRFRSHPEWEVLVGDVYVSWVISLAGVFFASVPVFARICFVPVVRADGHGQEPDGAEGQEEPRHR